MFTGIVEAIGTVVGVERGEASSRVVVRAPGLLDDAVHGASIAVEGVCLTVVDVEPAAATFTADVMAETLARSTLATAAAGSRVNLERAMPASGRFGGHVVQGHVDGTTRITARRPGDRWEVVTFALPAGLARYVVEKGSITVDGTSLTVSAVDDAAGEFSVSLIPTTLAATTLGLKAVGEVVNLEVDVLAKYVERMLADRSAGPS